jgi:hypothetical protein
VAWDAATTPAPLFLASSLSGKCKDRIGTATEGANSFLLVDSVFDVCPTRSYVSLSAQTATGGFALAIVRDRWLAHPGWLALNNFRFQEAPTGLPRLVLEVSAEGYAELTDTSGNRSEWLWWVAPNVGRNPYRPHEGATDPWALSTVTLGFAFPIALHLALLIWLLSSLSSSDPNRHVAMKSRRWRQYLALVIGLNAMSTVFRALVLFDYTIGQQFWWALTTGLLGASTLVDGLTTVVVAARETAVFHVWLWPVWIAVALTCACHTVLLALSADLTVALPGSLWISIWMPLLPGLISLVWVPVAVQGSGNAKLARAYLFTVPWSVAGVWLYAGAVASVIVTSVIFWAGTQPAAVNVACYYWTFIGLGLVGVANFVRWLHAEMADKALPPRESNSNFKQARRGRTEYVN